MTEKILINFYSRKEPFKDNIDKIFKSDCHERCQLTGDLNSYTILDGDEIKNSMKKDGINSVDCILLKKTSNRKINIILCELCDGKKGYKLVRDKMKDSGEHICKVLSSEGIKISNVYCLYLGDYKKNDIKFKSNTFSITGYYRNDLRIINKNCGFSVNELFNNN